MFKQSSRLNIVNFFFSAILNRYKKPLFFLIHFSKLFGNKGSNYYIVTTFR